MRRDTVMVGALARTVTFKSDHQAVTISRDPAQNVGMTTLYGMTPSGNCWKAAQILRLTGHPFRWVEVDTNGGETRTPTFLTRFPMGKVPVVETDNGTVVAESNAILAHFGVTP